MIGRPSRARLAEQLEAMTAAVEAREREITRLMGALEGMEAANHRMHGEKARALLEIEILRGELAEALR